MKQPQGIRYHHTLASLLIASYILFAFEVGFLYGALFKHDYLLFMPSVFLAIPLALMLAELARWATIGPTSWVVDKRGLWKGVPQKMELKLDWRRLKQWSVAYDSDNDPVGWEFETAAGKLKIMRGEVADPGVELFENEVLSTSGKPLGRRFTLEALAVPSTPRTSGSSWKRTRNP